MQFSLLHFAALLVKTEEKFLYRFNKDCVVPLGGTLGGLKLATNHAANGYDFAKLLCSKIVPALDKPSSEQVLEQTKKIELYAGEQGQTQYTTSSDGDKSFPFPIVIRKVVSQDIETINAG